jgi:hypothetical protein
VGDAEFRRRAGEPGFVPSGTNPPIPTEVSLKGFSELEKAKGEMRVNLPELGENAHTYAPSHVAQDVNKVMPEFLNMERNLDVIEQLGKQHAVGDQRADARTRRRRRSRSRRTSSTSP